MKKLVMVLIVGAICLAAAVIAQAQQSGGEGKTSSRALPAQECKAIEQYIARIDAARSIREKAQRETKYSEAQAELKAALKSRDNAAPLAQATEYANTTEQVATMDPMDSKLSEVLDKRLKLRGALLERCEDYTATR
jgi:7-keto-8-aminopelargonate synthetase-like enzyme